MRASRGHAVSDVFLSYASADRDRAQDLAEILGQRGYSVWWDRTIPPGRVFDEVIQEALSGAHCVVVMWSKASVASNWVKTEAADAASRHVLVPAVIEDVRVPIEFRRIQAANLQDWNGDPQHPELENLAQSIARLARGVGAGSAARPKLDQGAPGGTMRPAHRTWLWLTAAGVVLLVGVGLFLAARTWRADDASPGIVTAEPVSPQPAGGQGGSLSSPPAEVATPTASPRRPPGPNSRRVNLLAAENGGAVVAASDDQWAQLIDGKENEAYIGQGIGVFGFRDGRRATFDTFAVLVSSMADSNLRDFELLAGNGSPTGAFESIGTFRTQNIKLFKTPFQEFTFPAVTAKFLKVRPIDNHGGNGSVWAREFQLWGDVG
jgi:hypothetical protein